MGDGVCVKQREYTMLTVQSVLVLLMTVMVSEGTITGPGGCTTTCCMSCHLGSREDNCNICYKLNPPSLHCPCLDSLNKEELKRLLQLRGNRTETRTEVRTQKAGERGSCVPVCCHSVRCSQSSCPLCYRRHRLDREKCPCKIW